MEIVSTLTKKTDKYFSSDWVDPYVLRIIYAFIKLWLVWVLQLIRECFPQMKISGFASNVMGVSFLFMNAYFSLKGYCLYFNKFEVYVLNHLLIAIFKFISIELGTY